MKFEIIVSREKKPDFWSRQIMKALKTDYSHAAIVVDRMWLYQSTHEGFHRVSLGKFLETHDIWLKPVWVTNGDYALGWLDGCIGTEYGLAQYGGFILPWLGKLFKNGRAKQTCSEAVADFLVDCCRDGTVFKQGENDFITPKHVWESLK